MVPLIQTVPMPEPKRNKFTPIQEVLDISDPNILWYYIPGFNGYEINPDYGVRSMKHYRQYPFGILIQPRENVNTADPTYEISDNKCERKRVRFSQLLYLAKTNPYGVTGYPRRTNITDTASRNQRCTYRKQIKIPPLDNTARYPKFTVIPDMDDPRIYPTFSTIHEPIIPTDGSNTFYGREDYRTLIQGYVY